MYEPQQVKYSLKGELRFWGDDTTDPENFPSLKVLLTTNVKCSLNNPGMLLKMSVISDWW